MPQNLEIKRKLSARSDRVKSVDFHPTEPWILSALYNGKVYIWNYTNQELVKTFDITELPVRCAKFIARKQWVIAGADDMLIRVYNYNTMEKVKTFEGHGDYIRCIAVHPTQPYILTSSDDMLIKLWDWDKNWAQVMVFEGHNHYVMQVVFNPKDPNTFVSASLDRTIKVWGLSSPNAHFTLEGHEKGVNAIEYFVGGDKPYLISGSDDKTVKVWDYHHKTCVQTLEGHSHNVSVVCFHPTLQVIVSGSEDGSVRLWHSSTYRLEKVLNYGLERVWALGYLKGSNKLAIGYDEGTVMIKLASEAPAVSMDSTGKIIWAKGNEIQGVNVKTAADSAIVDGEKLSLVIKDLGSCEFYPGSLHHNPNGRFVVVCGDGEFIIFTSRAWRNKSFGSAVEFVWAGNAGEYAVRESSNKVKIFKNFKETKAFRPPFNIEAIYGGAMLSIKSGNFICFYDWDECRLIRRIDVTPQAVYWSENGELVAIACDSSFYILKCNQELIKKYFDTEQALPEDGIEDAFEVLTEIGEKVRTAYWVGDCFIYTNNNSRLNYCVGGEVVTISHLDRKMYLLGYIAQENRLYLIDKSLNVVSYSLHISIINYQTAILRRDIETASKILAVIPPEHHNRIAQFLEAQGLKEQALEVASDPDHKFDLAIQLNKLDVAFKIATESDNEQKWKQLGDLALNACKLDLAEQCLTNAHDLGGLLLIYFATANADGLARLAESAVELGKNNIGFLSFFLLRRIEDCIELLVSTGRIPEAAFLARTYLPSQVSRLVKLWREDLQKINQRAAASLADPMEYENLFPDLKLALKAELLFKKDRKNEISSSSYMEHVDDIRVDLIKKLQESPELQAIVEAIEKDSAPASASSDAPTPSHHSVPETTPAASAAPKAPAPATTTATTPAVAPTPAPTPTPVPTPAATPAATPAPVASGSPVVSTAKPPVTPPVTSSPVLSRPVTSIPSSPTPVPTTVPTPLSSLPRTTIPSTTPLPTKLPGATITPTPLPTSVLNPTPISALIKPTPIPTTTPTPTPLPTSLKTTVPPNVTPVTTAPPTTTTGDDDKEKDLDDWE